MTIDRKLMSLAVTSAFIVGAMAPAVASAKTGEGQDDAERDR